MKKLYIGALMVLFIVFMKLECKDVYALPQASSNYNVNILISETGESWVEYNTRLKNEGSDFYIRDYSIETGFSDCTNLSVSVNENINDFRKEFVNGKVKIKIFLQNNLVYVSDTVVIKVKFQTSEINNTSGKIRSIYIPSIKTEERLESASYIVKIPKSFGEFSYISLDTKEIIRESFYNVIKYNQKDAPFGTLILFGDSQQFEFKYNYRLENDLDKDKLFTISLPPDSVFQKTYYVKVLPLPLRAFSDVYGNTIIEYKLKGKEKLDVSIFGITEFKISNPYENLKHEELYLMETEYWDYRNDLVSDRVNSIAYSSSNYEKAKQLYEYVINNYEIIPKDEFSRYKASEIIEKKLDLDCQNVVDLYVAFLRRANIPSREAIGFSNIYQDVNLLHYWAEFYTGDKWISADPCMDILYFINGFENIDLNRIILAYLGLKEYEPKVIPPFTKLQDTDLFALEINLSSNNFLNKNEEYDINFIWGDPLFFSKNVPITVVVDNRTQSILRVLELKVDNIDVDFQSSYGNDYFFEVAFPYQKTQLKYMLRNIETPILIGKSDKDVNIVVKIGTEFYKSSETIKVSKISTLCKSLIWLFSIVISLLLVGVFNLIRKGLTKITIKKLTAERNDIL